MGSSKKEKGLMDMDKSVVMVGGVKVEVQMGRGEEKIRGINSNGNKYHRKN